MRSKKTHRPSSVQDAIISRLNRIEGQVKGVRKLVVNDVYCDDIIHQVSAIRSALAGVSALLIESHLETCVAPRFKAGDPHILAEFTKTIRKVAH